jgi:HK97 family phage major capsid protein
MARMAAAASVMTALAGAPASARNGQVVVDLNRCLADIGTAIQKHRDEGDQVVARSVAENRDFTKEETEKLEAGQKGVQELVKRRNLIQGQLDVARELETVSKPRSARAEPRAAEDRGDRGRPRVQQGRHRPELSDEEREFQHEYRRVFTRWLRFGETRMQQDDLEILQRGYCGFDGAESRDLSATTGAAGGFSVPEGFITQLEEALLAFGGIRQSRAEIMTTSGGNDLPYPTANDTSNEGEMVAENQATGTQDPTFGQKVFKSYLFSSKLVLVPIQLLQDNAVDIEAKLARMVGTRIARAQNRKFTVGTGASEPEGVVTAATLGVTAASQTAIAYTELVDTQHSVDPAYRDQAQWMFHDTTFATLRKLTDGNGRPIWQPYAVGIDAAPQSELLGRPYIVNQHMAVPAASAKTILWGDFSKFMVRQVRDLVVVRLVERYAEKFQVGFLGFQRADSKLIDAGTHPIKYLQQHS